MGNHQGLGGASMKTIEEIKAELREMIALGQMATDGPWESSRIFADWGFSHVDQVATPQNRPEHTGLGITLNYGGVIQCVGPKDKRNTQSANDAAFIARSRTMTPLACKGLLLAIEYIGTDSETFGENTPRGQAARSQLESIIAAWPQELL
jgi:hypothetical protein